MARAQDVDEDGHTDLVFLDRRGIVVFRNAGGRLFQAGVVPEIAGSNSFAIGDLNHDGHANLVLTGKTARVLFGDGRGRFANGPGLPAHAPHGCEIADLNGDGLPDVVVADNNDGSVFETASYIYWNSPAGLDAGRRTELPASGAQSAAIGDVDGDGRPDLIFLNTLGGHVKRTPTCIYFGNERGEYSIGRRRVIETDGANDGASPDLNDDGYTDLLLTQNLRLKPESLPKEIASGAIRETDGSIETQPIIGVLRTLSKGCAPPTSPCSAAMEHRLPT
jgi:FG-GAP-like repeat